ncbi:MAG: hypothetical protein R6W69_02270 [Anaerolineales bacterium]
MTIFNLRTWYTRFFALLFIGALYFVLVRSADVGVAGLDTSFWGYRKLIANYADLRLALGDRVFPNVLIGEDGWMIFTAERSMDDYQNSLAFSDEQIIEITQGLAKLKSRLAARNATLLVVIAPNKPTVYPEIMPPGIEKFTQESRLERLTTHLEQNLPGVLLDLRPILGDARAVREVYYKTDTHWNDYGVYLVYQAILGELAKTQPELVPFALEMFELQEAGLFLGDLAENTGSVSLRESSLVVTPRFENPAGYRELEAGPRRVLTAWTDNPQLPRLLMYHDSFGPRLFGLLGMHFEQAVSVPHYSGRPVWSLNWIEQHNPDVVLIQIAERYLHDLAILLSQ